MNLYHRASHTQTVVVNTPYNKLPWDRDVKRENLSFTSDTFPAFFTNGFFTIASYGDLKESSSSRSKIFLLPLKLEK